MRFHNGTVGFSFNQSSGDSRANLNCTLLLHRDSHVSAFLRQLYPPEHSMAVASGKTIGGRFAVGTNMSVDYGNLKALAWWTRDIYGRRLFPLIYLRKSWTLAELRIIFRKWIGSKYSKIPPIKVQQEHVSCSGCPGGPLTVLGLQNATAIKTKDKRGINKPTPHTVKMIVTVLDRPYVITTHSKVLLRWPPHIPPPLLRVFIWNTSA